MSKSKRERPNDPYGLTLEELRFFRDLYERVRDRGETIDDAGAGLGVGEPDRKLQGIEARVLSDEEDERLGEIERGSLLQGKLLDRKRGQAATPTDAGDALYETALEVLGAFEAGLAGRLGARRLTVKSYHSVIALLVPRILEPHFFQQHRPIRVEFSTGETADIVRDVALKRVQIGIGPTHEGSHANVVKVPEGGIRFPRMLFRHVDYSFRSGYRGHERTRPMRAAELAEEVLFVLPDDRGRGVELDHVLPKRGVNGCLITMPDTDAIYACVRRCLGLGLGIRGLIEEADRGVLEEVEAEGVDKLEPADLSLLLHKDWRSALPAPAQALVALIEERLRAIAGGS